VNGDAPVRAKPGPSRTAPIDEAVRSLGE